MSRLSFGVADLNSSPLRDFSKSLTGKECDILCRRAHYQTMKDIAELYDVTPVRIRQIQLNALRKLKSNEDELKFGCQWHPIEDTLVRKHDCHNCGSNFERVVCISLLRSPKDTPECLNYCSEGCYHDISVKRHREKLRLHKRRPRMFNEPKKKTKRKGIVFGNKDG